MRILTDHGSDSAKIIAEHVALSAAGPADRAFVRLNMISSTDGGSAVSGVSGGLGNSDDSAVFAALRAAADVVLVGMGTAVSEHYHAPGAADPEILVVASRPTSPARRSCSCLNRVHAGSAGGRRSCTRRHSDAGAPGKGGHVDLREIVVELAGSVMMLEGGPTLAGLMMAGGLVDEFPHHRAAGDRRRVGGGGARSRRRTDALAPGPRFRRRFRLPLPALLPAGARRADRARLRVSPRAAAARRRSVRARRRCAAPGGRRCRCRRPPRANAAAASASAGRSATGRSAGSPNTRSSPGSRPDLRAPLLERRLDRGPVLDARGRVPVLREPGDGAQRARRTVAADRDRRVRLLHRLRLAARVAQLHVRAVEVAVSCESNRTSASTPSSNRSKRSFSGGSVMPYASHSCWFQPAPTPTSSRPSEMMSMVAAMFASTAGWR